MNGERHCQLQNANCRSQFDLTSSVLAAVGIGTMGVLAHLFHAPLLFPSLGPTLILFATAPQLPAAAPRNAVIGHLIGLVCGIASLALLGLTSAPPNLHAPSLPRVACAALALGATTLLTVVLNAPHPPAGATSLIVALGLMRRPDEWLAMVVAVSLLTTLSYGPNLGRIRNRNRVVEGPSTPANAAGELP